MLSELDILRSAKLVLDHHGEDALVYAARRADELLERGDAQTPTRSQRCKLQQSNPPTTTMAPR